MGAPSRLKIKEEIRYRKGSTNESQNCRYCKHFVPLERYPYATNKAGTCKIILFCLGDHDSIRDQVREDHTCDRQEFDESKRNFGWKS